MCFIDDEEAGVPGQFGHHVVAKGLMIQAFWTYEQHIDSAVEDQVANPRPLSGVLGVDCVRYQTTSCSGFDLVSHEREKRREDQGRPGTLGAHESRGDEIHRRFPPPSALHAEHACSVGNQ